MTIAGDLDVILERYGVKPEKTQECIEAIFEFFSDGNVYMYLLSEEEADNDVYDFYQVLNILRKKIVR